MSGPWEKYQRAPAAGRPWEKYAPVPSLSAAPVEPRIPQDMESPLPPGNEAVRNDTADQGGDDTLGILNAPGRGIAHVVGAPVDLVSGVLRAYGVPIPEKPVGGSEWLMTDVMGNPTLMNTQPRSPLARIAARALEDATSAAFPMGTAMGMGRRATETGEKVRELLAGRSAAERAAQVGISAAGGLGSGAAQEIFPDSKAAQLVGQALGAGTGLLSMYGAGTVRNAVAPLISDEARQAVAGTILRRAANDPKRLNVFREDILPGSQLTTAQAMGDPGLAVLERGMRSEDPKQGTRFAMRDAERGAAQRATVAGQAPANAGGADTVQGWFGGVRNALANQGAEEVTAARQQLERQLQDLGTGSTPAQSGRVIREDYQAGLNRARDQVRSAYDAIDPERGLTIPTQRIWSDIAPLANDAFAVRTGGTPGPLAAILGRLRAESVDFRTLDQLAKEADNYASMALNQGDRRAAEVARGIATRIRSGVDDAIESGAANPETAALYQRARQMRRNMGDQFERGASGAVGRTKDYGEPALTESEVPGAYWNSSRGGADDTTQFIRTFGDRSRAATALTDYAVGDLRRVAMNPDGTLNATAWRNWMRAHAGPLRAFPELRTQLETVVGAQDALDRTIVTTREGMEAIDRTLSGRMLGQDAQAGFASIMNSPTRAREIRLLMAAANGNPDRLAALRRAALDWLQNKATQMGSIDALGNQTMGAAAYKKALAAVRNDWQMTGLFSPEHMRALEAVADDMTQTQFAQQAGRAVGSNTYQNLSTGNLISQITFGMIRPDSVAWGSALRPIAWLYRLPDEQVRRILTDAMLDPELAGALARKATPDNINWLGRQLTRRLKATVLTATAGSDGGSATGDGFPRLSGPGVQPQP